MENSKICRKMPPEFVTFSPSQWSNDHRELTSPLVCRLRLNIFELAIQSDGGSTRHVIALPLPRKSKTGSKIFSRSPKTDSDGRSLNLAWVCKELRAEVLPVFFKHNTIHVTVDAKLIPRAESLLTDKMDAAFEELRLWLSRTTGTKEIRNVTLQLKITNNHDPYRLWWASLNAQVPRLLLHFPRLENDVQCRIFTHGRWYRRGPALCVGHQQGLPAEERKIASAQFELVFPLLDEDNAKLCIETQRGELFNLLARMSYQCSGDCSLGHTMAEIDKIRANLLTDVGFAILPRK